MPSCGGTRTEPNRRKTDKFPTTLTRSNPTSPERCETAFHTHRSSRTLKAGGGVWRGVPANRHFSCGTWHWRASRRPLIRLTDAHPLEHKDPASNWTSFEEEPLRALCGARLLVRDTLQRPCAPPPPQDTKTSTQTSKYSEALGNPK